MRKTSKKRSPSKKNEWQEENEWIEKENRKKSKQTLRERLQELRYTELQEIDDDAYGR